ncbi:MAG TPA: phenylalanine--tRNA ligase beta subunit-related protein [Anaerolineales bacterium]|nr:phenylalanine--tRNA ligase beta subunit-related protein [Anaerolineales bacterium]
MQVSISPKIVEKYPSYTLYLIYGIGVQVSSYNQAIDDLLRAQEEMICSTFANSSVAEHPNIASWRDTYSSFGSKPSKYHCAVESLSHAVIKRGSLPRINTLVDLCNAMALKYVLPIDVMDVDQLAGDVQVLFSSGTENFLPLGSREIEHPDVGEVIYADDTDVLGRRWNWRKCDKNKVTLNTKTFLITVEGIGKTPQCIPQQAAEELAGSISRFFKVPTEIKDLGCHNTSTQFQN